MNISEVGLNLIKEFESCRLTAYQDVVGKWTVGYGQTGPGIGPGTVWTQDRADAALDTKAQQVTAALNLLIRATVTQSQFDACGSLAYNIGCTAFEHSTLLRLLNGGYYNGAMEQFPKWSMAGGVQIAGLLRRRLAEQQLFKG